MKRTNGYGSTRSGSSLRPSFNIPIASGASASMLADMLADEVKRAAALLEMSCADTLAAMRRDKVVTCDDHSAEVVLKICEAKP